MDYNGVGRRGESKCRIAVAGDNGASAGWIEEVVSKQLAFVHRRQFIAGKCPPRYLDSVVPAASYMPSPRSLKSEMFSATDTIRNCGAATSDCVHFNSRVVMKYFKSFVA